MIIPNKFNGYEPDGTRIYCKGGKGGSNKAAKLEAQRQANMQKAINSINSIFDNAGRDSLYSQQNDAIYQLNKDTLDKQFDDQSRTNRFALARNGLIGGSAEIDSVADLAERYDRGLLQAQALGQEAAAKLQQQDESARSNLIGLAQSGLDSASASAQATQQLANNYDNAMGARGSAAISNFFDDMGQLYLANKLGQAASINPYAQLYQQQAMGGQTVRNNGDQGH